ncbi:MAG: hypothetical protein HC822_10580 [Oscillochloris sp.]|nr:hypothetical protein [Oscillochloris sp.]
MIQISENERLWRLRLLPKDLGVALVVLLAFGAALGLMWRTTNASRPYADPDSSLRMQIPQTWIATDSLLDVLFKLEDPFSPSAFKTNLTVETRLLDLADPPTLQTLLDRRVEERSEFTGYHFLSEAETMVAGERAIVSEYAYVVQPIDEPRRASLPVVVLAREYIVIAGEHSYYLTLAAPESDAERALERFAQIIASVELQ